MNYEDDLKIDENSLDLEWLDQANLAMRYGKNYADCRTKLMQAEEKIKVVRAKLIKEANDDPDTCLGQGVKPTGPNVEAYYRTHEDHIEAKQDWIDASYECNMAEIAKNEISFTRKAALENLVILHGQQYFAGPKVPRNISNEREKQQKQQSVNRKIKLNRTK